MPDATPPAAYQSLETRFRRIGLIGDAEAMLHWDYAAMMPDGGAEARTAQLAELAAVTHGLLTASETADLLARAEADKGSLDPWQAANLREMTRRYRRAVALDEGFVSALAQAEGVCEQAWRRARAENDFSMVAKPLAVLTNLVREKAGRIGAATGLSPYDALLDAFEPGCRAAAIDPIFDDLAAFLPPLLEDVLAHQSAKGPVILPEGPFAEETQRTLGIRFMEILGFDFERGRLDVSLHPFCGGVPDDVRITTRYDEADFTSALMGVLHETGHALYNQGLPEQWRYQPVGGSLGMSVHESQSLMMEMQVCRSRPFLEFAAPLMRDAFGGTGPGWQAENIVRLYHKVDRSFIRVDADEVTYPLHIILRYRLERALLADDLKIDDIPAAWNDMFKDLIGLDVSDDAQGCLQDIHWHAGMIGYFPTYTLGAMTAAQLFQAATDQDPAIPAGIANGDFRPLLSWLRTHIHAQGRLKTADDILRDVTGAPLGAAAFKKHLAGRYGPA